MSPRTPKSQAVKGGSANAEQTCAFWGKVSERLEAEWCEDTMVKVLSPRQGRKYHLALVGVEKFQHILDTVREGYIYYPLPEAIFEKHLYEWDIFDLLLMPHLEEKYIRKVRPKWMKSPPSWQEIIQELKIISREQALSSHFFHLWDLYTRRSSIVTFINEVRPYEIFLRSMIGNETRIVEKYIYALWMHTKNYKGGRNKNDLGSQLLKKIGDAMDKGIKDNNRLKYYEGLMREEGGLIRSVTDMKLADIKTFIEDDFFSKEDFPELFITQPRL